MMKKIMLSICLLCACTTLQAQGRKHTTFFDQRATLFEVLPTSKKDIIFLGNSITNGGEWAELLTHTSRTEESAAIEPIPCSTASTSSPRASQPRSSS